MRLRLGPLRAGVMVCDRTSLEALAEKLSGWQKKQWVRADQPMDESSLRRFAQRQRGQAQGPHGGALPPGGGRGRTDEDQDAQGAHPLERRTGEGDQDDAVQGEFGVEGRCSIERLDMLSVVWNPARHAIPPSGLLLVAFSLTACGRTPQATPGALLGYGTPGVESHLPAGQVGSLDAELAHCRGIAVSGGLVSSGPPPQPQTLAAACDQLHRTMHNQPGNAQ